MGHAPIKQERRRQQSRNYLENLGWDPGKGRLTRLKAPLNALIRLQHTGQDHATADTQMFSRQRQDVCAADTKILWLRSRWSRRVRKAHPIIYPHARLLEGTTHVCGCSSSSGFSLSNVSLRLGSWPGMPSVPSVPPRSGRKLRPKFAVK